MQFASADEESGEMIVPASLYRMMAGRIFPEGVLQETVATVGRPSSDQSVDWDAGSDSNLESSEFTQ
jgi:hypothetical protein